MTSQTARLVTLVVHRLQPGVAAATRQDGPGRYVPELPWRTACAIGLHPGKPAEWARAGDWLTRHSGPTVTVREVTEMRRHVTRADRIRAVLAVGEPEEKG